MNPLEQNLKWLLLKVSMPTKQILHKIAERHDLTIMQLITLCLMEWEKEIPMNNISTALGCDASNVTGIVDRLMVLKIIERHECESDRRIKMISLSETGHELRNQLLKEMIETPAENLDQLTTEEQKTLTELLIKALPKEKK